jgi:hypothetical protein
LPLDLSNVADDKSISDEELIKAFGVLLSAMQQRQIIRTKNIVGELGERYCEITFNQQADLPNLNLVPTNAMDIDATGDNGLTYSIKSASFSSAKRTGAFHLAEDHAAQDKRFDYLLVCILNDSMSLRAIYRFDWEMFWKLKSWSKTQKAWFLSLSKRNLVLANKVHG